MSTGTRDIPEDIMAYARELWRQGGAVEASPQLAIARAILGERERCYKIAIARRSFPSRDMDVYGTTLAIDIASAIRNSQPASPRQADATSPFVSPSLAAHDGDKSAATSLKVTDAAVAAYKSAFGKKMADTMELAPFMLVAIGHEATRSGIEAALKVMKSEGKP